MKAFEDNHLDYKEGHIKPVQPLLQSVEIKADYKEEFFPTQEPARYVVYHEKSLNFPNNLEWNDKEILLKLEMDALDLFKGCLSD